MMPVTFKKDLKYFYNQKRAFSKNCHFKKISNIKNYDPLILYDASHQEVLLHKRAPCVHTRIRCPSSMSIEQ
jgi:hypothetical protein